MLLSENQVVVSTSSYLEMTTEWNVSQYNCSNHNTNSSSHWITYFVEAYISPSIFIIGILTNAITFGVLREMSLGKICKLLLCSLCATDFLASVVGLMSNLLEIVLFHGEMPFGHLCSGVIETYTTYFTFMMLLSMSHTVVIVVAIIRVYSMTKPFKSRSKLKKRLIVKYLMAIYITVFILFLPVGFYIMWQSCFKDIGTVAVCQNLFETFPSVKHAKIYLTLLLLIFGPVIVLINLTCLVLLQKAMRKSQQEAARLQYTPDGDRHSGSGMRKSMRITWVLFCVLIINTICIIPICIQSFLLQFDSSELVFNKDNMTWAVFDIITETMLQVVPCYNFWTYLCINKDFRRTFKHVFLRIEDEDSSTDMNRSYSNVRVHSTGSLSGSLSTGNCRVNGVPV